MTYLKLVATVLRSPPVGEVKGLLQAVAVVLLLHFSPESYLSGLGGFYKRQSPHVGQGEGRLHAVAVVHIAALLQ